MSIKQQGGVFGRHPEFSTIEVTDGADMSATAKPVQTLNRSDDGDIIRLEVAGSYVGAIGGRFGDMTLGTGSIGFRFDNTTKIVPWNMNTNLATNGVMDLGVTGAAFKNLYLTENVVIGTSGKGIDFSATSGTGTSELFDDYEEGYHTTTLTPNTSGSITLNPGVDTMAYTKIGRLVHVSGQIGGSSVSSPTGTFVRLSLPFAIANLDEFSGGLGGAIVYIASGTVSQLLFEGIEGETSVRISVDPSTLVANASYKFSFSYLT